MPETAPEIEKSISFKDFIKDDFNKNMSVEQAIEKLCQFHTKSSREAILNAFINLKKWANNEEGVINFREGLSAGNTCIVMDAHSKGGAWAWNHLIDMDNGQPLARCH